MIPEISIAKVYGKGNIISAQGEARAQICKIAYDKKDNRRVWLYSDADHVYCGYPFNTDSRGMGGAKIDFAYVDADENFKRITLHGPWCTSAESLYEYTGVDIRDGYMTRGLVAFRREYTPNDGYIYRDVIHFEPDLVKGYYDRIDKMALKISILTKKMTYYHKESYGGTIDSFEGEHYEKDSENQDTCRASSGLSGVGD